MVAKGLQWPQIAALRDAGADVAELLCLMYFDARAF